MDANRFQLFQVERAQESFLKQEVHFQIQVREWRRHAFYAELEIKGIMPSIELCRVLFQILLYWRILIDFLLIYSA